MSACSRVFRAGFKCSKTDLRHRCPQPSMFHYSAVEQHYSVSINIKILQAAALRQVREAGLIFPVASTVCVEVIFIVVTTVSIAASGSCCGRRKEGHPYGAAYCIKSVWRLGRFLRMSTVGHSRPDFISAKSIGILAFISRSRNKTLIPGNSFCITLYTEWHRCAQDTAENTGSDAAVTCSPTTVGLKPEWTSQPSGPGHCFRPPIKFSPSPMRKKKKFWESRCDPLNLFVPLPVSLLLKSQDAESITWPDVMLVTARAIRCGAEWQTQTEWKGGHLTRGWSRKGKKKNKQDIRKRTGSWSVKKQCWVGKQIPKWVLLIPVESLFLDPNALPPQCLLPAVRWLQRVLGTVLRTWPTAARRGPQLFLPL